LILVKTLLSHLVAKGTVDYEQIGNSERYDANLTRERMTRREGNGFLDRVFFAQLHLIALCETTIWFGVTSTSIPHTSRQKDGIEMERPRC
jgi:penicillinase repressor